MSRAVEAGMPVTYLNSTINAREQIEKLKKEIEMHEKGNGSNETIFIKPFSRNKHELKSRVTARVVEEPKGRPMFLLYNILGEDNSIIPVAFDLCSSYTLLYECVPSKLLWASPANLPEREVGRRESKY